jgi:hypothetical protein
MKKLIVMLALVLGVFALSQRAEAQHHQPGGYYDRDYVTCDSHHYNYNECQSYRIRRIDRVRVVQQHSHTYCDYGRTWGADPWSVWVDHGCSATFEVLGWTK